MATVLCMGGENLYTRHPLLKTAGFEVVTATSRSASLAAGRLPQVNAVILDTHSPIDNVTALATELKCIRPSLPILLVSDSGVEDGLQPGIPFDCVLSRLDGPSALLETLHELTCGIVTIDKDQGTGKPQRVETLPRRNGRDEKQDEAPSRDAST